MGKILIWSGVLQAIILIFAGLLAISIFYLLTRKNLELQMMTKLDTRTIRWIKIVIVAISTTMALIFLYTLITR